MYCQVELANSIVGCEVDLRESCCVSHFGTSTTEERKKYLDTSSSSDALINQSAFRNHKSSIRAHAASLTASHPTLGIQSVRSLTNHGHSLRGSRAAPNSHRLNASVTSITKRDSTDCKKLKLGSHRVGISLVYRQPNNSS